MKFFRILPVLALLATAPALAQDNQTAIPRHAVAMHGDVKYGPDFTHFDYVNPDTPKGGTLRLNAVGTFDSLNPFIVKGTPAGGMTFLGTSMIYESLMDQSYDEPFSMYGVLAESIELPDDRTWVAFNLRPQAKWTDGQPVTAEDVVWTFNTLMEKGTPFFKAYYGEVDKVEATSPSRVKFTLKHPDNAELPLVISQMSVLPKHYWTAPGRDFGATSLEPPLGSGPYKVGRIEPGRSISYVRDPNWWGKDLPVNRGRYNFDTVTFEYYRDSDVALEAFLAGEYDIREENTAKLWASAYNAPPVKDGRIIKAELPHQRPQGLQGYIYNTRRPLFADRAVREALAYALDFEWGNKQFAFGSYKRTRSYFSNSDLESKGLPEGRELEILERFRGKVPEEVFTAEYNPPVTDGSGNARANLKRAGEILDAAGYKTGKDGIRVNAAGTRMEFEIIDANPAFERWAGPFIQNLAKIGVKASFRVIDPAQYQNRMNNFDFDMTTGSFGQSESPGNEQRDFWGSDRADAPGSRNLIGIKDPVVDELITLIIKAPTREDLVARVHALDRVLQWGFYTIPQWHLNYWRLAWWSKLKHPEKLSPITPGISDTWWAEGKY
jgi:microcin C transport system substrate-binding protein